MSAPSAMVRHRKQPAFLTRDEEFDLARRWREQGDQRALERLILSHQPLVGALAGRMKAHGCDRADMRQEGQVGLMIAANRFDPDKGFRFATFAQYWVRATILDYVHRNAQIMKRGATTDDRREFFAGNGYIPILNLDKPIAGIDGQTLADAIPAPLLDVDSIIDVDSGVERLRTAVSGLNPREKRIVTGRHFRDQDDAETLDDLGRRFGISKERVRQIETVAIAKVKKAMGVRA